MIVHISAFDAHIHALGRLIEQEDLASHVLRGQQPLAEDDLLLVAAAQVLHLEVEPGRGDAERLDDAFHAPGFLGLVTRPRSG